MKPIQASVGKLNGKDCYNVPEDQEAIEQVLDKIPVARGGTAGTVPWPRALWGKCSTPLHSSILNFQTKNGLPYVDGHVDPGGATWVLLARLASTPAAAAPG